LFIVFFPYALLEENGWRGFALRHLLDQHSPFVATLIAGIPWALLHVTLFLFFLPESVVAKGLSILSFAMLLTWIFVKSGRNVLAATVLHGALNAFGIVAPAIPEAEASWYVLGSASLVIAILILIDGRLWFTRSEETMDGESVPSAA
jgi:membrane protease YdiL (CAAX protease family)